MCGNRDLDFVVHWFDAIEVKTVKWPTVARLMVVLSMAPLTFFTGKGAHKVLDVNLSIVGRQGIQRVS